MAWKSTKSVRIAKDADVGGLWRACDTCSGSGKIPTPSTGGKPDYSNLQACYDCRGAGLTKSHIELAEDGHQDAWRCICGNRPSSSGFYASDKNGEYATSDLGTYELGEDHHNSKPEDWDGVHYRCDECGRIIDQNTGEIKGMYAKGYKHARVASLVRYQSCNGCNGTGKYNLPTFDICPGCDGSGLLPVCVKCGQRSERRRGVWRHTQHSEYVPCDAMDDQTKQASTGVIDRHLDIPTSPHLDAVLQKLHDKGHKALIVGGAVRDAMLGEKPKDVDVEVYGTNYDDLADTLKPHGKVNLVGKAFGVVKFTDHDRNEYDFSLPRRDNKTGIGHKDFETEFDPDITPREAASRRDFTFNALAYDPVEHKLHDYFGGEEDLKNKTIRHTSEAFAEDPLRVLRGMQFAARYGMDVHPETAKLSQSIAHEYPTIPKERVGEEFMKLATKGKEPGRAMDYLKDTGWHKNFPEIHAMYGVKQDKEWHPEGDLEHHVAHSMNAAAKIADREGLQGDDRAVTVLGALCHDMGKPSTTKEWPYGYRHIEPPQRETEWASNGGWRKPTVTSHGHDEAGEPIARKFLSDIGIKPDITNKVAPIVREHMQHINYTGEPAEGRPNHRVVRRLAQRMAPASIKELSHVVEADHSGRPPLEGGMPSGMQNILNKAERSHVTDKPMAPLIQGRHVLPYFDNKPGPHIGEHVKAAYQAQLDGEISTPEEAQDWLHKRLSPNEPPPTKTGAKVYHVAPSEARESIEQHGLDTGRLRDVLPDWEPSTPGRIHVFKDEGEADWYRGYMEQQEPVSKMDIWQVDADEKELEPDRGLSSSDEETSAHSMPDAVHPSRVKRIGRTQENWQDDAWFEPGFPADARDVIEDAAPHVWERGGSCDSQSNKWEQALKDRGVSAQAVHGHYHVVGMGPALHSWVDVGGRIFDPTAGQWGKGGRDLGAYNCSCDFCNRQTGKTSHLKTGEAHPHKTLYHVSLSSRRDAIQKDGLKTWDEQGLTPPSWYVPGHNWAWDDLDHAKAWANTQSLDQGSDEDANVDIWKIQGQHYEQQHDDTWEGWEGEENVHAHKVKGNIAPEHLQHIHTVTPDDVYDDDPRYETGYREDLGKYTMRYAEQASDGGHYYRHSKTSAKRYHVTDGWSQCLACSGSGLPQMGNPEQRDGDLFCIGCKGTGIVPFQTSGPNATHHQCPNCGLLHELDTPEWQRPHVQCDCGAWWDDPRLPATKKGAKESWEGFPFDERKQEKPKDIDQPPVRTDEGHFVLYHGTSPDSARSIMKSKSFTPDDFGMVGFGTTPQAARIYGIMKAGPNARVLRVEVDKDWLAKQRATREIGGSGHDQFLIGGSGRRSEWTGVPPEAIRSIKIHRLAMAADPDFIKGWIDKHGPYLWHGVSARDAGDDIDKMVENIKQEGIKPNMRKQEPWPRPEEHGLPKGPWTQKKDEELSRTHSEYDDYYDAADQWWLHPRPNHVFMTTHPKDAYAEDGHLFRIDLRKLNPKNLKPDDDHLRDNAGDERYNIPELKNYYLPINTPKDWKPKTLGEQANELGWGDNPEHTHQSFEADRGVIAHEGVIPPDAIEHFTVPKGTSWDSKKWDDLHKEGRTAMPRDENWLSEINFEHTTRADSRQSITAWHPAVEMPVGHINWVDDGDGPYVSDIDVEPEYRRRGLGGELLSRARLKEPTLHHDTNLTPEGEALLDAKGDRPGGPVTSKIAMPRDDKFINSLTFEHKKWDADEGVTYHNLTASKTNGDYVDHVGSIDWNTPKEGHCARCGHPDDWHDDLGCVDNNNNEKCGCDDEGGYMGSPYVSGIDVNETHQRKGLATELWHRALALQPDLDHDEDKQITDEGHEWIEGMDRQSASIVHYCGKCEGKGTRVDPSFIHQFEPNEDGLCKKDPPHSGDSVFHDERNACDYCHGSGLSSIREASKSHKRLVEDASSIEGRFGPDRSKVVHTFDDNWTIRQLQTEGDKFREGRLMSNCWDLYKKLEPSELDVPRMKRPLFGPGHDEEESVHYSLRDPDNIPHVSFFHGLDEPGVSQSLHGAHNKPIKPQYLDRIREWNHGIGGRLYPEHFNEKTASWRDVRNKAVRLRNANLVDIIRFDPDVIASRVQGDHHRYDVVLYRQYPDSWAITMWECSCKWGDWAFKRQVTFVGRMCSHALATLYEAHSMENKTGSNKYRPHDLCNGKGCADCDNSGLVLRMDDRDIPAPDADPCPNCDSDKTYEMQYSVIPGRRGCHRCGREFTKTSAYQTCPICLGRSSFTGCGQCENSGVVPGPDDDDAECPKCKGTCQGGDIFNCEYCHGSGLIKTSSREPEPHAIECWKCPETFEMGPRTDECPSCGAHQYVRGVGAHVAPKPLRQWMAENHHRAYMDVGTHDAYRKWDLKPDMFHAVQGTSSPGQRSISMMSHPSAKPEWTQAVLLHEVGHNIQYEDWDKAEGMSAYDREGDATAKGRDLAAKVGIEWTDAHENMTHFAHGTYAENPEDHYRRSSRQGMAVTPEFWKKQGPLYHLTSFHNTDQIEKEGLIPHKSSGWYDEWAGEPRKNHVYLFTENPEKLDQSRSRVVVDPKQLDHQNIRLDEDFYAHHFWDDDDPGYDRYDDMPYSEDKGAWAERHKVGEDPAESEPAIEEAGTLAHHGMIPASAIHGHYDPDGNYHQNPRYQGDMKKTGHIGEDGDVSHHVVDFDRWGYEIDPRAPVTDEALLEIVGADPTMPPEEVKKTFRQTIRENHPDILGDDGDKAKTILNAYEELKRRGLVTASVPDYGLTDDEFWNIFDHMNDQHKRGVSNISHTIHDAARWHLELHRAGNPWDSGHQHPRMERDLEPCMVCNGTGRDDPYHENPDRRCTRCKGSGLDAKIRLSSLKAAHLESVDHSHTTMFHVAPRFMRDDIDRDGLKARGGLASPARGRDGLIYAWPDEEKAQAWCDFSSQQTQGKSHHDIWKVDTKQMNVSYDSNHDDPKTGLSTLRIADPHKITAPNGISRDKIELHKKAEDQGPLQLTVPRTYYAALESEHVDYPKNWEPGFSDVGKWQEGTLPTDFVRNIALRHEPGLHSNRGYRGEGEWDAFKNDIKQNGIKHQLLIYVNDPNDTRRPELQIEGHHRLLAAHELGMSDVPVEVRYYGTAHKTRLDLFAGDRDNFDKGDEQYRKCRSCNGKGCWQCRDSGLAKVRRDVVASLGHGNVTFYGLNRPITIDVEVARDARSIQQGLMMRTFLGPRNGMVFISPFQPSYSGFWMKSTLLPLSIAFWDKQGIITEIIDMEPCPPGTLTCPTYQPKAPYWGAIEVNRGFFRQWGINPGARIELNL